MKAVRGRPALLLLYHSDCLHCQYELSQLDSGLTQLDPTSVVLLTTEDSTATGMFEAKWPHLLGAPGVQRAHIDPAVAQRAFGINATPAVFIVDPRDA